MSLPDYIKGAIFDLDGTLLDSMWIWADIDKRFLSKRGIEVPPDYMAAVCAMEYRQTAEYTIARFGLKEKPEDLMQEWSEMAVGAYATELKLKPSVRSCLAELKARGIKLAVATSATPDMCIPALKNNGVDYLFDAVVTTQEIGKGKAHPDVYLAAAKRLGVTPETCAVYEDNLSAIKTAKNAGFYTVGVYDKFSRSDEKEIRQIAEEFIEFGIRN
ncbi:MAG: HAD family phosphatase [Clostridiales bacterium]|nr:HAD family phosphatase [Clostridiales bacterium]